MEADRLKNLHYILLVVSGLLYIYIGYYVERHQSFSLIISYISLFLIYYYLFQKSCLKLKHLVLAAVLFRITLLFSLPGLSDDIYRFVWDGKLLHEGIHPFAHVPSWFVNSDRLPESVNIELYRNLNSPDYFTIYPPVGQFLFWLSAFSNSILGSAIIMRVFVLAAEVGSVFLLVKLLEIYGIQKKNIILYALNPLVILELMGNLHLEAFMIFFLLLGIYLYKNIQIFDNRCSYGPCCFSQINTSYTISGFFAEAAIQKTGLCISIFCSCLDFDVLASL